LISEVPTHAHQVAATTAPASTNTPDPTLLLAQSTASSLYGPAGNAAAMAQNALSNAGGSQAHPNMQPFLTLSFCIALQGIFPSQS
jgi:microcystin-dependent protein